MMRSLGIRRLPPCESPAKNFRSLNAGGFWMSLLLVALSHNALLGAPLAGTGPFESGRFKGRIAYSADGNHNDPDDWIASPMVLAILAESGLKDRLVHFDYNCIIPLTKPDWELIHTESVLGAVERYGFDKARFFDCRRNLEGAIADIAKAVDESSAENPLYFIVAGPMEVPYRGIEKSSPAKRKFVYCISHSRWNDGFASSYKFTHTKRSVIEQDVHWVQIQDQNRLLSLSRYGQPARPEEFSGFFWLRDSADPKLTFLWERTVISTRPDPSDAGMAWFLVTGDEECDPAKLKGLIAGHRRVPPISARKRVRLEAENFRELDGFVLEDRKDKNASHQLNVRLIGKAGSLRTDFDEPFTRATAQYDVVIRYLHENESNSRLKFLVDGRLVGSAWTVTNAAPAWRSHTWNDVAIGTRAEIRFDIEGAPCRIDYVQLNARE